MVFTLCAFPPKPSPHSLKLWPHQLPAPTIYRKSNSLVNKMSNHLSALKQGFLLIPSFLHLLSVDVLVSQSQEFWSHLLLRDFWIITSLVDCAAFPLRITVGLLILWIISSGISWECFLLCFPQCQWADWLINSASEASCRFTTKCLTLGPFHTFRLELLSIGHEQF